MASGGQHAAALEEAAERLAREALEREMGLQGEEAQVAAQQRLEETVRRAQKEAAARNKSSQTNC